MPSLTLLAARIYEHVLFLRGWVLLAGIGVYLALSWILFALAGEEALVSNFSDFLYFASTTASTVGYGDLAPQTQAGRIIAAVFFFPAAVTIFTIILAKLTGSVVEGVRKLADGRGSFASRTGATVIVGYHADRTERMIVDLIAGADNDHTIVLLTRSSNVNVPSGVHLVVAEKLDSLKALRRAAIEEAAKVLIYADSDAETFNACLAVREMNADVHVAAYFNDRETAARAHRFADVETVVSSSTDVLVRAAQDPGSSTVLQSLSSAVTGSTVYSAVIGKADCNSLTVRNALYDADTTLIAVNRTSTGELIFAPFPDWLEAGTIVYYISKERITESDWRGIQVEKNNV